MTIIRAKRTEGERYTTLRRATVNDARLSFRALGLLAYILDKPSEWRIEATELSASHREGRDAVRTALTELEEAGYLTRRKYKNDKGQFATDSIVSELPASAGKPVRETSAGFPGPFTSTESNTVGMQEADASCAAAGKPPRFTAKQRDDMFVALAVACGMDVSDITPKAKRTIALAAQELLAIDARPEEVEERVLNYALHFRDAALTPTSIAKHWAQLAKPPRGSRTSAAQSAALLKEMIADEKRKRGAAD